MIKQLYRFRVQSESSPGVLSATDEADESRVWLVSVGRPDRSDATLKKLEAISDKANCESFTAAAEFYTVAASEKQVQDLRSTFITHGYLKLAEPAAAGPVIAPDPYPVPKPVKSRAGLWRLLAAAVLGAIIIVAILRGPPRSTDTGSATTPPSAYPVQPAHNYYAEGRTYYQQRQFEQAKSAFQKACDENNTTACSYLAYLYSEGLGGPRDLNKARDIYSNGCRHNVYRDCEGLGMVYETEDEFALAARAYQTACGNRIEDACKRLAHLPHFRKDAR